MARLRMTPLPVEPDGRSAFPRWKRRNAVARVAPPATVLVRPELLRAITTAAVAAGGHESGGPLIGTVQRSWEGARMRLLVSILGTVPPGPRVDADTAFVALGRGGDGERASFALRWWRSVTGLDLLHLGDWHKHHFRSPEPSEGDHEAAARIRWDGAATILLAAIAVSRHESREDVCAEDHLARYAREWTGSVEVRFYRQLAGTGLVRTPIRVEDDALPCLPALPWHVADAARFAAEFRLLDAAGFKVEVDATGVPDAARPGLALRISSDGDRPLTAITGPRYPQDVPALLDDRGRPVADRFPWSADRFLVDLVKEAR